MTPLTQLVLEIQQGHADISELYKPLTPVIKAVIRRYTHSFPFYEIFRQGTCEDMEQTCWCTVLETLPKFDISLGYEYSTYVVGQLKYVLLKSMETKDSKTQRRTISYDTTITDEDGEEISAVLDILSDENATKEFSYIEREQIYKIVADAVDNLPEDLRTVLIAQLRFNSLTKVSTHLGISLVSTRTLYRKALTYLYRILRAKDITEDFFAV